MKKDVNFFCLIYYVKTVLILYNIIFSYINKLKDY